MEIQELCQIKGQGWNIDNLSTSLASLESRKRIIWWLKIISYPILLQINQVYDTQIKDDIKKIQTTNLFITKTPGWCDCAFLFIVRSVSYSQLLRVKAGLSIIYLFIVC